MESLEGSISLFNYHLIPVIFDRLMFESLEGSISLFDYHLFPVIFDRLMFESIEGSIYCLITTCFQLSLIG